MAEDWVTLNNGYKYNRKTGETIFEGEDSQSPIYRYDPTNNRTLYNGQQFTGRYDPYAISGITGEDYEAAFKNYEAPYLDKEIAKLEKNPFITTEKNVQDAFTPVGDTFNRLSFGQAYDTARKRMDGPGFFDEIKDYDFGSEPLGETPDEFLASHPGLTPELQERMKRQLQVADNFKNQTGAYGSNPVSNQPTLPAAETPDEPAQPDQPDWQSLYDQLAAMMGSQTGQQKSSQPREQIGSFIQYGAGNGKRESYKSSTPYGSKGS